MQTRVSYLLLSVAMFIGPPMATLVASEVHIEYQSTNETFPNPERGFYVQKTARSHGRPLSSQSLQGLRGQSISLILRMYYLKSFRDRPLSNAQLELMRRDFATLRRHGCKCILRFAYSSRLGEPDAPLDRVIQHIGQLEPIIRENADVILVLQTGFIGPWGEMHSSTNGLDSPASIRKIVARLLSALPPDRSLQVRTPMQKRICIESDQPLTVADVGSGSMKARIGHYNDCFLANETDVGTYESGRVKQQKQYLALDSRFVPMGGETCRTSNLITPDYARREFSRMHWSFLHLNYHPQVIATWRKQGFLQEVGSKLGYRLELVSFTCGTSAAHRGKFSFSLMLKNTGWAAPINDRDVFLVAKRDDLRQEYRAKLDVNPRTWLPNQTVDLSGFLGVPKDMPFGEYRLYLSLPDPAPQLAGRKEYSIRLANNGLWDDQEGTNVLHHKISVNGWSPDSNPETTAFFLRHP
ncbi:MAG: DUF4832 domain-containing protein [Planctomycetota bacterium]